MLRSIAKGDLRAAKPEDVWIVESPDLVDYQRDQSLEADLQPNESLADRLKAVVESAVEASAGTRQATSIFVNAAADASVLAAHAAELAEACADAAAVTSNDVDSILAIGQAAVNDGLIVTVAEDGTEDSVTDVDVVTQQFTEDLANDATKAAMAASSADAAAERSANAARRTEDLARAYEDRWEESVGRFGRAHALHQATRIAADVEGPGLYLHDLLSTIEARATRNAVKNQGDASTLIDFLSHSADAVGAMARDAATACIAAVEALEHYHDAYRCATLRFISMRMVCLEDLRDDPPTS